MRKNSSAIGDSGESSPAITLTTLEIRHAADGSAVASPSMPFRVVAPISANPDAALIMAVAPSSAPVQPDSAAAAAGSAYTVENNGNGAVGFPVPRLQIPSPANPLPGTIYSPAAGATGAVQPQPVKMGSEAGNPDSSPPNTAQRNANEIARMMARDMPGLAGMRATYREGNNNGITDAKASNGGFFSHCCKGNPPSPRHSSRTVIGEQEGHGAGAAQAAGTKATVAQRNMEREPTPFPVDVFGLAAERQLQLRSGVAPQASTPTPHSGAAGPALDPTVLAEVKRLQRAQQGVPCDEQCTNCSCCDGCCNSAPQMPALK